MILAEPTNECLYPLCTFLRYEIAANSLYTDLAHQVTAWIHGRPPGAVSGAVSGEPGHQHHYRTVLDVCARRVARLFSRSAASAVQVCKVLVCVADESARLCAWLQQVARESDEGGADTGDGEGNEGGGGGDARSSARAMVIDSEPEAAVLSMKLALRILNMTAAASDSGDVYAGGSGQVDEMESEDILAGYGSVIAEVSVCGGEQVIWW